MREKKPIGAILELVGASLIFSGPIIVFASLLLGEGGHNIGIFLMIVMTLVGIILMLVGLNKERKRKQIAASVQEPKRVVFASASDPSGNVAEAGEQKEAIPAKERETPEAKRTEAADRWEAALSYQGQYGDRQPEKTYFSEITGPHAAPFLHDLYIVMHRQLSAELSAFQQWLGEYCESAATHCMDGPDSVVRTHWYQLHANVISVGADFIREVDAELCGEMACRMRSSREDGNRGGAARNELRCQEYYWEVGYLLVGSDLHYCSLSEELSRIAESVIKDEWVTVKYLGDYPPYVGYWDGEFYARELYYDCIAKCYYWADYYKRPKNPFGLDDDVFGETSGIIFSVADLEDNSKLGEEVPLEIIVRNNREKARKTGWIELEKPKWALI